MAGATMTNLDGAPVATAEALTRVPLFTLPVLTMEQLGKVKALTVSYLASGDFLEGKAEKDKITARLQIVEARWFNTT